MNSAIRQLSALWQLHHRPHILRHHLRRRRRNSTLVPDPCWLRDAGFLHCRRPWRRLLLRDTLDPSPQGLEDEGLHLSLADGALLCAPTSFFSCNRLAGAICVTPTGLDFDVRPGGVICATLANLPLGVSLSGVTTPLWPTSPPLFGARV